MAPGSSLFESHIIRRGMLVLLKFESPFGILAMANHNDYFLVIGLRRNSQTEWYDSYSTGFYFFGGFSATVEIVATEDTELIFSAEDLGGGCTTVAPACSGRFSFSNFSNSSARACFLRTDAGVRASLSGSIGSGSLLVRGPSRSAHFDSRAPIPNGSAVTSDFHAVRFFNGGDNASDLDIEFAGGGGSFEFSSVDASSAEGVFGRGNYWKFNRLYHLPEYPPIALAPVWIALAVVGGIVVVLLLFGAGFWLERYMVECVKEREEPLFDVQGERRHRHRHHHRSRGKTRNSTQSAEDELEEPVQPEEPRSPYDVENPSL
jgi:hypothetical protein